MSLEMRRESGTNPAPLVGLQCRRCNAIIGPGKKFCSQCGCPAGMPAPAPATPSVRVQFRTSKPTLCPECGFQNHHTDRFCKGCGAVLAPPPPRLIRGVTGRGLNASALVSRRDVEPPESVPETASNLPPATPADALGETRGVVPEPSRPRLAATSEPPAPAASIQAPGLRKFRLRPLEVATSATLLVAAFIFLNTRYGSWRTQPEKSSAATTAASASAVAPAPAMPDSAGAVKSGLPDRSAASSPGDSAASSGPEGRPEAVPTVSVVSLPISIQPSLPAEGGQPLSSGSPATNSGSNDDPPPSRPFQPARLLAHSAPPYPAEARAGHVEGNVYLVGTVRTDGTLVNLKVASGAGILASASLGAARDWRYRPAQLYGEPIQTQTGIKISFRLPN
jgi:outer membrane biosynthesis protein TonB